jgi:heat shock protein HtpX
VTADIGVVRRTDFVGAARRNTRNTVLLTLGLVAVGGMVGYAAGWGMESIATGRPLDMTGGFTWDALLRGVLSPSDWGIMSAAGALAAGTAWSLIALLVADWAILSFMGAKETTREEEPVLHNVVEEMAIASGLPKPRVYVIEDSGLNAFATGLRPSKSAVAVTRGLLETLDRDELQGVVAHEMAHVANRDVRFAVMVAALVGVISAISRAMMELPRTMTRGSSSRRSGKNGAAVLVVVLVVWLVVAVVAVIASRLLQMAISRQREYLADATAVRLTRNPKGLASALGRISRKPDVSGGGPATEHLFIASPSALTGFLSTHPPIEDRVRRILDLG